VHVQVAGPPPAPRHRNPTLQAYEASRISVDFDFKLSVLGAALYEQLHPGCRQADGNTAVDDHAKFRKSRVRRQCCAGGINRY
jgi:hypothetical protein